VFENAVGSGLTFSVLNSTADVLLCAALHRLYECFLYFKSDAWLQGSDVPQSRSLRFREEIKLLAVLGIE
jgi:hypothetical protein